MANEKESLSLTIDFFFFCRPEGRMANGKERPVRRSRSAMSTQNEHMTGSILDQRPELPALSRDAHPSLRDVHTHMAMTRSGINDTKSRANRVQLFASTYQNDFSQPQIDR